MKKHKINSSPHVRIYFAMMESKAWKALPTAAQIIYLWMLKEHRGRETNRFSLSYSQIQDRTAFGNNRISAAVKALEKAGFINILERGGLFKAWNVYALSDQWKTVGGAPKSKEELPQSPAVNGEVE